MSVLLADLTANTGTSLCSDFCQQPDQQRVMDLGTKQPRLPDVFHQPGLGHPCSVHYIAGFESNSRNFQDAPEEKGGGEEEGWGWMQEAREQESLTDEQGLRVRKNVQTAPRALSPGRVPGCLLCARESTLGAVCGCPMAPAPWRGRLPTITFGKQDPSKSFGMRWSRTWITTTVSSRVSAAMMVKEKREELRWKTPGCRIRLNKNTN